ncbi:50S ribosomal protein L22 [Candidatus Peregrinibacteria bacterium]|nr:MAG: 50S ribosomal protein L22 [Candidatus Peregrinibacteria bacterium]
MKASVRDIRISPKKVNLVAGIVRNMPAKKAVRYLALLNKRAAGVIKKVIDSAIANAKNNDGKLEDALLVGKIIVTKGRTLRRGIPSSRGRVAPIKKRSSHIFVELTDTSLSASE